MPTLNASVSGSEVKWSSRRHVREWICISFVLVAACVSWIPRRSGPIDLRWDGGTYYILGTSLAEGKGYRLLNEPGEIAAIQYPPLLPAIVALHQQVLGTSEPAGPCQVKSVNSSPAAEAGLKIASPERRIGRRWEATRAPTQKPE